MPNTTPYDKLIESLEKQLQDPAESSEHTYQALYKTAVGLRTAYLTGYQAGMEAQQRADGKRDAIWT